ncbi:MAG: EAL domain-containing protein [Vibrio sp.]
MPFDLNHQKSWPTQWQQIVNVVTELAQTKVGLIMKKNPETMEVLVASDVFPDNPYHVGDQESLNLNLYCHHVIQFNEPLHVPNALEDEQWRENPDIALGMVAYYGIPIHLPNGERFGTFCLLDDKPHFYEENIQRLMQMQVQLIEHSLQLQYENTQLSRKIEERDNFHALTNLPTRSKVLEKYAEHAHKHLAILFVRSSQAFQIRNTIGLVDAQKLTKLFYQAIKNALPDDVDIYYISNSELIVVHTSEHHDILLSNTRGYTEQLLDIFATPMILNEKEITVPINIGCALSFNHEYSFEKVLDMSTVACTQGAELKKDFHLFNYEQQKKHLRNYEISQQFPNAFANDEFYLNFQPIFAPKTNEIIRCEVLVRWKNEKLGMVFPDEFIPLAEQCGFMVQLGDWIFEQALVTLKNWHKTYNSDFRIGVNISSVQFNQPDFAHKIEAALLRHHINPNRILLELTETAFLENHDQVTKHCQQLSNLGINFALDDFGTGYSSLSHLFDFPIDVVKVDKSFIFKLEHSPKSLQMVKGILYLGKMMNLRVVAEGVETKEMYETLRKLDCDFMQGYYWSRPLSKEVFEETYFKESAIDPE